MVIHRAVSGFRERIERIANHNPLFILNTGTDYLRESAHPFNPLPESADGEFNPKNKL